MLTVITSERVGAARRVMAPGAIVLVLNGAVILVFLARREWGFLLLAATLAVPVVVLGVLALVRRPQRGVLLLAALLPFDGLTLVLPIPPGWKEALVLLTLGAALIAPVEARGETHRRPAPWWFAVGALAALSAVSAALVGWAQALAGLKVGFFFVLVAVVVWRCPFDGRERDRLVTILMSTGFLTAVYGIAQQVLGPERLVDLGYSYLTSVRTAGGYLRSFSTFETNFPFALFLMLVILVGLPCALSDPRRPRNQLFLASLPVLLVALVFAITRAAWLGLVVGLAYLAVSRVKRLAVPLVHALTLAVVLLVLAGNYSATFLSGESSRQRVDVWRDNIVAISEHPLGLGVASTGSAAGKAQELAGGGAEAGGAEAEGADPDEADTDVLQPDNYYFKTTLELGVLGLWVLVLLLVTSFAAAHTAARRLDGADAVLAGAVAASILAVAAISLVATYFEVFPMDAYYWLLLGVVSTCDLESH